MMSDQYHVTVGKEKMKIDNLIYFFTRNGSKDCNLTILAVFLEKRSGKKKCAQCSVRSRAFDFSKHDPATLTHYIFITFLISTYIALMHQLS